MNYTNVLPVPCPSTSATESTDAKSSSKKRHRVENDIKSQVEEATSIIDEILSALPSTTSLDYEEEKESWRARGDRIMEELWLQSGGGSKRKKEKSGDDKFSSFSGSKSGGVVNQPLLEQVKGVLDNEVISGKRRRTVALAGAKVIGSGSHVISDSGDEETAESESIPKFSKEYSDLLNVSIYNDDKLYQQMIRDYVAESKGDDSLNPSLPASAPSKREKKKEKKKTDRRASKGRKVKYTVHEKLIGFMFGKERPNHDVGEDVWFKSLLR